MALASLPTPIDILDLRLVKSRELLPLFASQERTWQENLHWDYRASTEMLRRHIDSGNLPGYVARVGHEVVGYCFFLYENRKGLLGDLYVLPGYHENEYPEDPGVARLLLENALETLLHSPHLDRVEAQLISFGREPLREVFGAHGFSVFPRLFMYRPLAGPPPPRTTGPAEELKLRPWKDNFDEVADLIVDAYRNHVDSRLNDQYADRKGARKFLQNIITFPGCGVFQRKFSLRAVEAGSNRLAGILLTSEVAADVAHFTQVCMRREWMGRGVGRRMMEETLRLLHGAGFRGVSLTVTASNENAVRLYEQLGFNVIKEFEAYARNLR